MNCTKQSLALFGGALALIASSSIDARPKLESRDDVTFSGSIADLPENRLSVDLSSTSSKGGGKLVFDGDSDHADSTVKFPGKHEQRLLPVSAIPEPSTDALLVAGVTGIIIMKWRRSRKL